MNHVPRSAFTHPVHFLAVGLGSGAAPKAPGTWGTVAALVPFWGLAQLPATTYALVVAVAAIIGIYLCGKTARDWGVHDHGGIVWDEFVGLWMTLFLVPIEPLWILVGFGLFRLFDIWKPWPISVCDQRVHGGLGIMLDDVIAGVFAWLSLQLILVACGASLLLSTG